MSLLSIEATRALLVTALSAIAGGNEFVDVKSIPLSIAIKPDLDKAIFAHFPDLQLPACLVVVTGWHDEGKRKERKTNFALIVVSRDDAGNPGAQTFPRCDAIRALEGTQLQASAAGGSGLWLELASEGTVVDTDPIYSIVGIEIETREYQR